MVPSSSASQSGPLWPGSRMGGGDAQEVVAQALAIVGRRERDIAGRSRL